MSEIVAYLDEVKLNLISSPVIGEYVIIKERTIATDGYLRLRATLVDGDFLELTEYFVRTEREITTIDYRYQWMDPSRTHLRRRWDNTPHHPEIPNFPHHSHWENENHIVASKPMTISGLLALLETLIDV